MRRGLGTAPAPSRCRRRWRLAGGRCFGPGPRWTPAAAPARSKSRRPGASSGCATSSNTSPAATPGRSAAISRVCADVLTAHYRDDETTDGQQIHRLDADGNVRIVSTEGETAYGDQGVYHVDRKDRWCWWATTCGSRPQEDIITARDSLEFWEADQFRRGARRRDGGHRRDDRRLRADVLTAYTLPDASGKSR